jgi:hypothetical protein
MNQLDQRFDDLRHDLDGAVSPTPLQFEPRSHVPQRLAIVAVGLTVLGGAVVARQQVARTTSPLVVAGKGPVATEVTPKVPTVPSASCTFSEPNVVVTISPESVVLPMNVDGKWQIAVAQPDAVNGSIERELTMLFILPAGVTSLVISKGPGVGDGATEWDYSHSAVMTGPGLPSGFSGGCTLLPAGSVTRRVVADEKETVNLHDQPDANGKVVDTMTNRDQVWVKPWNADNAHGGWLEASVLKPPLSNASEVRVLTGWVKAESVPTPPALPAGVTGYTVVSTCELLGAVPQASIRIESAGSVPTYSVPISSLPNTSVPATVVGIELIPEGAAPQIFSLTEASNCTVTVSGGE